MAELLDAVGSWWSLVFFVAVFGFAPGLGLRLIVLAYPRSDPRRAELVAELYAVPRLQRPLWVAEQLEFAVFEGLGHRMSATIRQLTDWRRARTQADESGVRRFAWEWALTWQLALMLTSLIVAVGVRQGVVRANIGAWLVGACAVAALLSLAVLIGRVVLQAHRDRAR